MFAKLTAIARKDVYTTFQDRQALLLMFAAPLALSLIIGLAFGSVGDISIEAVPVAVLNADQGAAAGPGTTIQLGQIVQDAFVPTTDQATETNYASIRELIAGESVTDPAAARAAVEDGDLAALISIGPDFTQSILAGQPAAVEVYADSGQSIGPSIVLSIAHSMTNGLNSAVLAQSIAPQELATLGEDTGQDAATIARAVQRAQSEATTVGAAQPIRLQSLDLQGKTRTFDALQYFAPSMAILFLTFAMANVASGILHEQQHWTLQRIISSPTPRWVFIGGKLAGTYLTGVLQMIVLIASTSLLAAALGRTEPVWGTNLPGIALLVLAVVFASTSFGMVLAAIARTTDQAGAINTVVVFLMGMIGGSFFTATEGLPEWLPKLTLNHWGIMGFVDLSLNDASLADIAPNLLALLAIGAVFCVASVWRFNRRLDV